VPYEQSCPRCGRDFVGDSVDLVADAVVEHARDEHGHRIDREVVVAHLVTVHPHYFELGQRKAGGRVSMRLSARNQLHGVVIEVHDGEVTTTVKVRLEGGDTMTSSITKEAAAELGLEPDKPVVVIVKASDVMIGTAD
jgi:molybdopterin-binding protein